MDRQSIGMALVCFDLGLAVYVAGLLRFYF